MTIRSRVSAWGRQRSVISCALLVIVAGLGACKGECDAGRGEALLPDLDAGSLKIALVTTWEGFSRAIQPDQVCIAKIKVKPVGTVRGVEAGGTYNAASHAIRVGTEELGPAVETLRHELCHAWHHQVLHGTPPLDVFQFLAEDGWASLEEELKGFSSRALAKEAFAFTCALDPSASLGFADPECGSGAAQMGIAYLKEQVYRGFDAEPARVDLVLDVPLTIQEGNPTRLALIREIVPGHLSVFAYRGEAASIRIIDIGTGEVSGTTGHLSGLTELVAPEMDTVDPPPTLMMQVGAGFGGVEAGIFDLSTPMGTVRRPLVRRGTGEPWRFASGACEMLAEQDLTSFFVAESGTALWSAVLEEGRLKVFDWSGSEGVRIVSTRQR